MLVDAGTRSTSMLILVKADALCVFYVPTNIIGRYLSILCNHLSSRWDSLCATDFALFLSIDHVESFTN